MPIRWVFRFGIRVYFTIFRVLGSEEYSQTYSIGSVLQVLWLDRVTGRVCMSISSKAMAITGIEDRRYWNWIPTEESRLVVYAFDIGNGLFMCKNEALEFSA